MPPATLWEQYAVAGIVFLALVIAAGAMWKVVCKVRDWMREESAMQRQWQADESAKRDAEIGKRDQEYRVFFQRMESERVQQAEKTGRVLEELAASVRVLGGKMEAHDGWARGAIREAMGSLHDEPRRKAR